MESVFIYSLKCKYLAINYHSLRTGLSSFSWFIHGCVKCKHYTIQRKIILNWTNNLEFRNAPQSYLTGWCHCELWNILGKLGHDLLPTILIDLPFYFLISRFSNSHTDLVLFDGNRQCFSLNTVSLTCEKRHSVITVSFSVFHGSLRKVFFSHHL